MVRVSAVAIDPILLLLVFFDVSGVLAASDVPGVVGIAAVAGVLTVINITSFPIAAGVSKILGYLLLFDSLPVLRPCFWISTVVGFPDVAAYMLLKNCLLLLAPYSCCST